MDSFTSAMESPKVSRRPFGEITNNMINTPIKEESPETEEVLTPMANLKMLIRVASETNPGLPPPKRELFREDSIGEDHDYGCFTTNVPGSGLTNTISGLNLQNFTPSPGGSTSSSLGPPKVSRKQKSLGLLCEKFMSRFPESVAEGEKCEIPLDDLAKQMATERRRIYDIVNVLEAVQMMTKVGKNLYQWHGIAHRNATLAWLRQLALKLKMLERYNEVKVLEESSENFYGSSSGGFMSPNGGFGTPNNGASPFSPSLSPSSSTGGPSPSPIERKTSLGVACQKFLMLFLIAPEKNAKINLDFAARVIHGVTLPEAVMKTRIRRLYDIANILQSLQLIQKVQVTESSGVKKPAFQYIGPDVETIDDLSKDAIKLLPSARQRNSLLAVGKNLVNIPDEEPEIQNFPPIFRSTSSADMVKPLKKRLLTGYNFENTVNLPINTSESLKRSASTSLLDLSNACEAERAKIRRQGILQSPRGSNNSNLIRISPQNSIRRSHIISPASISTNGNSSPNSFIPQAVTLLRKPLSPLTSLIRNKPNHQFNRTVISVIPPTFNNGIMDLSKKKY